MTRSGDNTGSGRLDAGDEDVVVDTFGLVATSEEFFLTAAATVLFLTWIILLMNSKQEEMAEKDCSGNE